MVRESNPLYAAYTELCQTELQPLIQFLFCRVDGIRTHDLDETYDFSIRTTHIFKKR